MDHGAKFVLGFIVVLGAAFVLGSAFFPEVIEAMNIRPIKFNWHAF